MSDDENTPARTPSSMQRITLWGIVEAWLGKGVSGRAVVMTTGPHGLRLTVIDPNKGEVIEDVQTSEDPSRAALRALERLAG